MKSITTLILIALVAVVGVIAHELCFEDTTFGGYLPFVFLAMAPVMGYVLGAQRGKA